MRPFIIAPVLLASAIAQSTPDLLSCAGAVVTSITNSNLTPCTSKNSQECLCNNKAAFQSLSTTSVPACFGLDFSSLISAMCSETETKTTETQSTASESTESKAAETKSAETKPAFRHAGRPMQPVKRADGPKLTIYVTETRSDCGCTSTAVGDRVHGSTPVAASMHISQIPVNVPTPTSMGAMVAVASSTPVGKEHGLMGGAASSSVVFGSGAEATPSGRLSGADPMGFSPYTGSAVGVSVNGAVVFGVAAVMAVIVAL